MDLRVMVGILACGLGRYFGLGEPVEIRYLPTEKFQRPEQQSGILCFVYRFEWARNGRLNQGVLGPSGERRGCGFTTRIRAGHCRGF